jgi:Arc/MetJ-type ribon-helix-helix transcriptional regulator
MKSKTKMLNIRIDDVEYDMVQHLRKEYFVDVSEFIRAKLRELFNDKTKTK